MEGWREKYEADVKRYKSAPSKWSRKFTYCFRRLSEDKSIMRYYYRYRYRKICEKHGIEIPYNVEIGKGLYMGHPYNITINAEAKLGENINIHKGAVVGQANRGKRAGAPVIGNRVWIGINAAVVGAVNIGDDVLIAPNSYVNVDVPSHSIVLGNPCVIIPAENATEGYINNCV